MDPRKLNEEIHRLEAERDAARAERDNALDALALLRAALRLVRSERDEKGTE